MQNPKFFLRTYPYLSVLIRTPFPGFKQGHAPPFLDRAFRRGVLFWGGLMGHWGQPGLVGHG